MPAAGLHATRAHPPGRAGPRSAGTRGPGVAEDPGCGVWGGVKNRGQGSRGRECTRQGVVHRTGGHRDSGSRGVVMEAARGAGYGSEDSGDTENKGVGTRDGETLGAWGT